MRGSSSSSSSRGSSSSGSSRGSSSSSSSRGSSSSGSSRGSSSSGSSRGSSSSGSSQGSSGFDGESGTFFGSGSINFRIRNSFVGAIISCCFSFLFVIVFLFLSFSALDVDYGKINAEVKKNTYINGYYYTTYEYEINDVEYKKISQVGWEKPETKEEVVIYYSLNDPSIITEILQKTEKDYNNFGVYISLAVIFTLSGTLTLVKAIKKKNKKDAALSEVNQPQQQISQSSLISCPYCGASYEKTKTKCPGCGAIKK